MSGPALLTATGGRLRTTGAVVADAAATSPPSLLMAYDTGCGYTLQRRAGGSTSMSTK